ncbi:hypothetical protein CXR04_09585 [Streptomyces sp. CMB-StM0423]|nr:hypothetical protein CXR04_09585 [Streptomyces sp. CMB-StM0423]
MVGLEWMPPPGTVWAVEAGEYWDAVRVDRSLGLLALKELGDSAGPVIQDPWGKILYFLVPPGSTRDWDVEHTVPCGPSHYVGVPPLEAEEHSLHWVIPPGRGRGCTRPADLRRELLCVIRPRAVVPGGPTGTRAHEGGSLERAH